MRLQIFDRRGTDRRRKISPDADKGAEGHRKGDRRKGHRRRRAAGLILGLASLIPMAKPPISPYKPKNAHVRVDPKSEKYGWQIILPEDTDRFTLPTEKYVDAELWTPPTAAPQTAMLAEAELNFSYSEIVYPVAKENGV